LFTHTLFLIYIFFLKLQNGQYFKFIITLIINVDGYVEFEMLKSQVHSVVREQDV